MTSRAAESLLGVAIGVLSVAIAVDPALAQTVALQRTAQGTGLGDLLADPGKWATTMFNTALVGLGVVTVWGGVNSITRATNTQGQCGEVLGFGFPCDRKPDSIQVGPSISTIGRHMAACARSARGPRVEEIAQEVAHHGNGQGSGCQRQAWQRRQPPRGG